MQNNFYKYFFTFSSILNLTSFVIVLLNGYDDLVLSCIALPFFISLFLAVLLGKEWQVSENYNVKKVILGSIFFFVGNTTASIFLFNTEIIRAVLTNLVISILMGLILYFALIHRKSRQGATS